MSTKPKILVTGASGKFGELVLFHLTETYSYPASQIIATTRQPAGLAKWAEQGVEVRKADFSDSDSLAESFSGAEQLLLISTDSLDNEVRLRTHLGAVAAAKSAGVGRILYTSMPQPDNSAVAFASVHLGTENAIKETGVAYTILRNNWYFENLLMTLPGALAGGTLYSAAGDGKIAYISRSDLAQAAAAALVGGSEFENRTFTLTGDEALDIESVAKEVASLLQKPLKVVQVPLEAIIAGAVSHGLPEPVAVVIASFDTASKNGDLATVTSDFATLTGRPPKTFPEWLAENRALLG
jgi:NAD(P)H dehydrogenase (quinone)